MRKDSRENVCYCLW